MLQWGHVFSDVEMKTCGDQLPSIHVRFNGATSFQTWKSPSAEALLAVLTMLQWGHVFSDVEITTPREEKNV